MAILYQTAVVWNGFIFTTSDGWDTWSQIVGSSGYWTGISLSSTGQYQTAVAYGNYIYKSIDYGVNWSQVGISANWLNISLSSTGQYQTAVVFGGYIYRSTDYGVNWSQVGISANWRSISISSTGKYQTALVESGYIYRSTDYGVNWSQVGISLGWFDISLSANGKYQTVACGEGYQIYLSSDYGVTWQTKSTSKIRYGISVSYTGQYQTSVIHNSGKIEISSDYGATWTEVGPSGVWRDISISATGQYQTAVLESGYIYKSIDYGETWLQAGISRGWRGISIAREEINTGKIYFYNNNTGMQYELNPPIFGYKTTIEMAVDYQECSNKDLVIFDNGKAYNTRYCDCKFILSDTTDQAEFKSFLASEFSNCLDSAKENPSILRLSAGSGFYPFGPDKGDSGDFYVAVERTENNPYILSKDYYGHALEYNLRFYSVSGFASVSFSSDVDEATFSIDNIGGLRCPINWYTDIRMAKNQDYIAQHSNVYNMVYTPVSGYTSTNNAAESRLSMICSTPKAQRLINSITEGDIRDKAMSISFGNSAYEFGVDLGNSVVYGDKKIRMNKLEILHTNYNRFEFDINIHAFSISGI